MSRLRDSSHTDSVLDHTETLLRGAVAFLPTILVATAFVVITFVDVGALAQQIHGNATRHPFTSRGMHGTGYTSGTGYTAQATQNRAGFLLPESQPLSPPPLFVLPTFLSFTRLRCRRGNTPELMRLLAPLANDLRRTEPRTLTFQLLQSEQEPDVLLLWERFRSRADMLRLHQATSAYVEFRRQLVRSGVVVETTHSSWLSTDVGFSGRQHARLSNQSSPRRKCCGLRV